MMVGKQQKEKKEDDLGQEIGNHSDHLRSRQYDDECYYCIYHGYVEPKKKEKENED